MSSEQVDRFVDRWLNDASFKARMLADPDGAVSDAGFTFSESDWASVNNVVAGLGGEALQARTSKGIQAN
jgi:hypothetical protein